ncbi:hypothetical protein F4804DRAFT_321632 [Jackrogersella minutella]|nr:hypothetical protein F4804DRAFT_321632 [Jackrogersella minutella]
MEYPTRSILISVFVLLGAIVLVVICARWGGLCLNPARWGRRTEEEPKPKLPSSVQHALTQLEMVTEKRPRRNSQTESLEAECPICLGYLYGEPRTSISAACNDVDLEAGNAMSKTITPTTDVTTEEKKGQATQPNDDEVLKMKRCTHMFHTRCLATWFLRKKYDCPVCRTPYFQVTPEPEHNVDYRMPAAILPVVGFW